MESSGDTLSLPTRLTHYVRRSELGLRGFNAQVLVIGLSRYSHVVCRFRQRFCASKNNQAPFIANHKSQLEKKQDPEMSTDNEITPIPHDLVHSDTSGVQTTQPPVPVQDGLQREWPPAYLGYVPSSTAQPLQLVGLETIDSCIIPPSLPSDKFIVKKKETNPLLNTWSADLRRYGQHDYLVLPPTVNSEESYWRQDENMKYPSDKLLARKSYVKAFSNIYKIRQDAPGRGRLIALGGTSGIGKTLFNYYVIWRLLHPDGVEVTASPRTILFCADAKDHGGYLFHDGIFYTVNSVGAFLATNAATNLFDGQDAWMIADSAPPPRVYHCPVLVSSSPSNFQLGDQKGAKKFFKNADAKVYLPPWLREEIWTVARVVYNIANDDDDQLHYRFYVFGGIPRSVLKDYNEPFNLVTLFSITDVATALAEVGSEEMNHSKVSGKILHLIPDNTLTYPRYEWASTCIMEAAFNKLFQMTRKKIESFLQAGYSLHLGTFYRLMFEPFFHATITEQGYNGKMRRLTPPPSSERISESESISDRPHLVPPLLLPPSPASDATSAKRHWWRTKKHWIEVYDSKIPRLSINHFHVLSDIDVNCYNIPDRKNFAAVDAIAPSRGEMYQITSAERHGIKGLHLRPLKKLFAQYLASGQKVKLIFVVPPNRFEGFQEQKYLFPPRIDEEEDKDGNKQNPKKRKRKMGANFDIIEWDDLPYVEDGEGEVLDTAGAEKSKKTRQEELHVELLKEVMDWVDQYALEISVDPMASSADKSVRKGIRKLNLKTESSATAATTSSSAPLPKK